MACHLTDVRRGHCHTGGVHYTTGSNPDQGWFLVSALDLRCRWHRGWEACGSQPTACLIHMRTPGSGWQARKSSNNSALKQAVSSNLNFFPCPQADTGHGSCGWQSCTGSIGYHCSQAASQLLPANKPPNTLCEICLKKLSCLKC